MHILLCIFISPSQDKTRINKLSSPISKTRKKETAEHNCMRLDYSASSSMDAASRRIVDAAADKHKAAQTTQGDSQLSRSASRLCFCLDRCLATRRKAVPLVWIMNTILPRYHRLCPHHVAAARFIKLNRLLPPPVKVRKACRMCRSRFEAEGPPGLAWCSLLRAIKIFTTSCLAVRILLTISIASKCK